MNIIEDRKLRGRFKSQIKEVELDTLFRLVLNTALLKKSVIILQVIIPLFIPLLNILKFIEANMSNGEDIPIKEPIPDVTLTSTLKPTPALELLKAKTKRSHRANPKNKKRLRSPSLDPLTSA